MTKPLSQFAIAWACLAACCVASPSLAASGRSPRNAGTIVVDSESKFSHVRVRKLGDILTMLFVRSSGEEVVESKLNLKKPYDPVLPYTRFMFASYLFKAKPDRVLIVGLGGGGMVHFLTHYDPDVQVDAVEIDPLVVKIADEQFGTRCGDKVKIVTADAFAFLADPELTKPERQYDVIYMDAFLKPSADTDATGTPLRLKTAQFYRSLQKEIKPDGCVVFNLNPHEGVEADIKAIRNEFPQTYVFRVADTNIVVVAVMAATRARTATLRTQARDLDHRFKTSFSFAEMVNEMTR